MPRRFFRKFALNRESLRRKWFIEPFDHLLHDPDLFGIRRRSVVPAFSLGLFIAFMPIPGHPLIAALLAIAFRVNVAVATVTTFISNPLTMGPMFFSAYWVGRALLGLEPQPFEFELSLTWLGSQFLHIWQPMLLGCVLLASVTAFVGYVTLDLLWRASIADYLAKRRKPK
ncbi:MAG TPA: DUF2062 domain-containing protein [Woeseiaceae bacterium]|jgi:uncharacterized protein (DUF2062 family)|nr:DUF2062 domain-containing protein [Woeseiaceae bacterium]